MTVQLPRLTIITLNCRGIRDDVRRRKLFYHLRLLELYSGQVQNAPKQCTQLCMAWSSV